MLNIFKKKKLIEPTYKFNNGTIDSKLPIISSNDNLIIALIDHLGEDFYKNLNNFGVTFKSPMKEFLNNYFKKINRQT